VNDDEQSQHDSVPQETDLCPKIRLDGPDDDSSRADSSNDIETGIEFVSEVRSRPVSAQFRKRYLPPVQNVSSDPQPVQFKISIQYLLTVVVFVAIGCALFVADFYVGIVGVFFLVSALIKLAIATPNEEMIDFSGWCAHVTTSFVLSAAAVIASFLAFGIACVPMGFIEFSLTENPPILASLFSFVLGVFVFVVLLRKLKV
jgi:hypothetical protein